jgi:ribosome-binding factor A
MFVASALHRTADPRFSMVTITAVTVSPDLKKAKVYWTVSGGADRQREVTEAFDSAMGMFRRQLGKELNVRFVPDLTFFYDNTLDTSEEVERLLNRIKDDHPENT